MKRIIAFTSGKGGSGKSTCCVSVALALGQAGHKVLLCDLDAGLRCLDLLTGVEENLVFDLKDVLEGKPLADAVLQSPLNPNIFTVAAPKYNYEFDGEALSSMLLTAQEYDYILLDFPAGTDFPFCKEISDIVDFIVVATADRVGMRDGDAMTQKLMEFGANCRLIINKFDRRLVKQGTFGGVDDIIDCCGCRLLGIVPFDPLMLSRKQGKFYKRTLTKRAFERISKRICGYEVRLPRIKKIEKGK